MVSSSQPPGCWRGGCDDETNPDHCEDSTNHQILRLSEPRFLRVTRELAALVHSARIRDAELRDQATRAAKSAFLCLCEGLPNDRASLRQKYFIESDNSLHEAVGACDLACAIGALDATVADRVQALGLRLRRMLRGLMRAPARAA